MKQHYDAPAHILGHSERIAWAAGWNAAVAELRVEQAKAWNEGKRSMVEYTQGARRQVPYPTNPYEEA